MSRGRPVGSVYLKQNEASSSVPAQSSLLVQKDHAFTCACGGQFDPKSGRANHDISTQHLFYINSDAFKNLSKAQQDEILGRNQNDKLKSKGNKTICECGGVKNHNDHHLSIRHQMYIQNKATAAALQASLNSVINNASLTSMFPTIPMDASSITSISNPLPTSLASLFPVTNSSSLGNITTTLGSTAPALPQPILANLLASKNDKDLDASNALLSTLMNSRVNFGNIVLPPATVRSLNQRRQYSIENRDIIREKMKVKIQCVCGKYHRIYGHKRHAKTEEHKAYVAEHPQEYEDWLKVHEEENRKRRIAGIAHAKEKKRAKADSSLNAGASTAPMAIEPVALPTAIVVAPTAASTSTVPIEDTRPSVDCECGVRYLRRYKLRHFRSTHHVNFENRTQNLGTLSALLQTTIPPNTNLPLTNHELLKQACLYSCVCGETYSLHGYSVHTRTIHHLEFMKANPNALKQQEANREAAVRNQSNAPSSQLVTSQDDFVTCVCGSQIRKHYKKYHENSSIHLSYMKLHGIEPTSANQSS